MPQRFNPPRYEDVLRETTRLRIMEACRRVLNYLDVLAFVAVSLTLFVIYSSGVTEFVPMTLHNLTLYCNDSDYWYKETYSIGVTFGHLNLMVAVTVLFIPVLFWGICENKHVRKTLRWVLPLLWVLSTHFLFLLVLNFALKLIFGHPRPCVFGDDDMVVKYCTGKVISKFARISRKEVYLRTSFPNYYTSVDFYGAVFTFLYMEKLGIRPGPQGLTLIIFLFLIIKALYSGIEMYYAHSCFDIDIVAGAVLGSILAPWTVRKMYQLVENQTDDVSYSSTIHSNRSINRRSNTVSRRYTNMNPHTNTLLPSSSPDHSLQRNEVALPATAIATATATATATNPPPLPFNDSVPSVSINCNNHQHYELRNTTNEVRHETVDECENTLVREMGRNGEGVNGSVDEVNTEVEEMPCRSDEIPCEIEDVPCELKKLLCEAEEVPCGVEACGYREVAGRFRQEAAYKAKEVPINMHLNGMNQEHEEVEYVNEEGNITIAAKQNIVRYMSPINNQ